MKHLQANYGIGLICLGMLIYGILIFYNIGKMVVLSMRNVRRFPRSKDDIKKCFSNPEMTKEFDQTRKKLGRMVIISMITLFLLAILISALNTEW